MTSKNKLWRGIAEGGLVAALIAFGSGGMGSADGNSVRAGMAGKSSGGVANQTSGNGI